MKKARRGIYAAAISPFNEDGSLNSKKLISYCQHLLTEGGCDGVAPTGTTGEGTSVAMADRLRLPEAFAAAGIETDRVLFGTGAPASGDCVALSRAAIDAGYNNVLVLPPYYHIPQVSAAPISTTVVKRLRAAFGPVIAGLKDSSGDFEQTRAFVEATGGISDEFDVYPSSESMLWEGLSIGTAGIISGSTNAFAVNVQKARNAPEGPERDAAMEAVRNARTMASKYPLMAGMKTLEAWRSGDDSWLRMAPPLVPLTAEQKAGLRADMAALTGAAA